MGKILLVEKDLEEARQLVHLLSERGLPVQMAAWVRRDIDTPFKLMIASPNVQKFGPRVVIALLMETLEGSNLALRLDDVAITNTTGMRSGRDAGFSYVYPVSGIQDEIFVFRSTDRVRAKALPPSAHAA